MTISDWTLARRTLLAAAKNVQAAIWATQSVDGTGRVSVRSTLWTVVGRTNVITAPLGLTGVPTRGARVRPLIALPPALAAVVPHAGTSHGDAVALPFIRPSWGSATIDRGGSRVVGEAIRRRFRSGRIDHAVAGIDRLVATIAGRR